MEMKRWSTRWKTKRWLWDPTLITIVTITFLLQAVNVKAGKELSLENAFLNRSHGKLSLVFLGDRRGHPCHPPRFDLSSDESASIGPLPQSLRCASEVDSQLKEKLS